MDNFRCTSKRSELLSRNFEFSNSPILEISNLGSFLRFFFLVFGFEEFLGEHSEIHGKSRWDEFCAMEGEKKRLYYLAYFTDCDHGNHLKIY